MADTRFVDLNVLKRAYETLHNIIKRNKKSTDANINDLSTLVDTTLKAIDTLADEAEKSYATKDELEQYVLSAESKYATKDNASTTYATKSELTTGLLGKSDTGHSHNYAGSSSVGGVATSAAKLATARNIAISGAVTGNANFDGSGNITISTAVNHNHDGVYQPIGSYAAASHNHDGVYQPVGSYAAASHSHNYAGSSSAGGSATSAVKLATARNIAISGAVTGNANFDGTSNITINTEVAYGTSAPSSLANGKLYCVIES